MGAYRENFVSIGERGEEVQYEERDKWEKEVMTEGRRRSTRRCRGEDWGGINHARTAMQMGCCCSRGANYTILTCDIQCYLNV